MNEEPVRPSRWQPVIETMFEELRSGEPRAEGYWAQQLAFGPVFFYAVILAVRKRAIPSNDLERLRQLVPLALSLLGALPDGSDGDSASLFLLAPAGAGAGIGPASTSRQACCTPRPGDTEPAVRPRAKTVRATL